jgi:hypothetical protein
MKTITIYKPMLIPKSNIRTKKGNKAHKPFTLQPGEYPVISEFQDMGMVYFGDDCVEVSHNGNTYSFIKRHNKPAVCLQ